MIGYTCGSFDLPHIGHINMIKNAKALCHKLIIAVSTDELIKEYKNKKPVMPYRDRVDVIKALKYVDVVIPQRNLDKYDAWERLKFDVLFVGDDWYGTKKWKEYEKKFKKVGVKIIYFPYTEGVSSTGLKEKIKNGI